MAMKMWFVIRGEGLTPTHFEMSESLHLSLDDKASDEQKSLAYKLLIICYLEGWQIRSKEAGSSAGLFGLHLIHRDIMGKKTAAHFEISEKPVFESRMLGMDVRERLLAQARSPQ